MLKLPLFSPYAAKLTMPPITISVFVQASAAESSTAAGGGAKGAAPAASAAAPAAEAATAAELEAAQQQREAAQAGQLLHDRPVCHGMLAGCCCRCPMQAAGLSSVEVCGTGLLLDVMPTEGVRLQLCGDAFVFFAPAQ